MLRYRNVVYRRSGTESDQQQRAYAVQVVDEVLSAVKRGKLVFDQQQEYVDVHLDGVEVDAGLAGLTFQFYEKARQGSESKAFYQHNDGNKEYGWPEYNSIVLYVLADTPRSKEQAEQQILSALSDHFYWGNAVVHELIHYLDKKRYKGKGPKTWEQDTHPIAYSNSVHEINARYQSALVTIERRLSSILNKGKPGSLAVVTAFHRAFGTTFDSFVQKFMAALGLGSTLTTAVRKRVIIRLGPVWHEMEKLALGDGLVTVTSTIKNQSAFDWWFSHQVTQDVETLFHDISTGPGAVDLHTVTFDEFMEEASYGTQQLSPASLGQLDTRFRSILDQRLHDLYDSYMLVAS